MGSTLSIVTVVVGLAVSAAPALAQRPPPPAPTPAPMPAPAPAPPSAAELARQGMDLYRSGDFAGAVEPLRRADELDPGNFEVKFTLAQALRHSGNCSEAVPHYRALVDGAPSPEAAAEVRTALGQCPDTTIREQPVTPPPPAPVEPQIVVRNDTLRTNTALLLGAGAGIGLAAGLFVAARSDDADADAAASFADHERISARADRLKVASLVSVGVGIGLGALALYRIKVSKEGPELALSPHKGGGTLVLGGRW